MRPETRAFLAAVRDAEDPSAADETRVLAALRATIGGNPTSSELGGATGASATKGGLISSGGAGVKALAALLGLSVGAALVASAFSSERTASSVVSLSNASAVAKAPPPSSAPAEMNTPVPSPPPNVSVTSPAATPPAVTAASARRLARSPARPAPSEEAASSASLREEIALLAGVQSALERGNGAEALQRLERHVTTDRQFIAERRAARIKALCQLGRVSEAQGLATVFFRENAQSVQRTAVERSCAVPKTTPER